MIEISGSPQVFSKLTLSLEDRKKVDKYFS